jgi:hypothetical protein
MTKAEKQNINARINELMGILSPTGSTTDATIYIHGDNEHQNATFSIHGDARLLANTIQHHIAHNEEFRRFIFATIGSYLSQTPDHEKEFFGGILAIKSNLGVN